MHHVIIMHAHGLPTVRGSNMLKWFEDVYFIIYW